MSYIISDVLYNTVVSKKENDMFISIPLVVNNAFLKQPKKRWSNWSRALKESKL